MFGRKLPRETIVSDMILLGNVLSGLVAVQKRLPKEGLITLSPQDRAFVDALEKCLRDHYQLYWMSECKGFLYRWGREWRATWSRGAIEDGPKMAAERMGPRFWGMVGCLDRLYERKIDALIQEFQQVMLWLSRAGKHGVSKGSRLDYVLDGLRRALENGAAYVHPDAVPEALVAKP